MWAWSKLYGKPNFDGFTIEFITALAVDPSGNRIAAIATDTTYLSANMFLIDAATGAQVSKRRYMDVNGGKRLIKSSNLLLQNDGTIYYGDNKTGTPRPNFYEQNLRIGVCNFYDGTYAVHRIESGFGRPTSLVRGEGLHS